MGSTDNVTEQFRARYHKQALDEVCEPCIEIRKTQTSVNYESS
jgi:hypothetical protein